MRGCKHYHQHLAHLADRRIMRDRRCGSGRAGNNTALTSVDLTCNHIGEEGAEGLAANTVLTSLDLTRNSISDRGQQRWPATRR